MEQSVLQLLGLMLPDGLFVISLDKINGRGTVKKSRNKMSCANQNSGYSTQSVTGTDIFSNGLTVNIPPDSAITKTYASMKQSSDAPIYNAFIGINDNVTNEDLFIISINIDPNDVVGLFETSLIQPFCIGANGASITILPLNLNTPVVAASLDITVIYCLDYCTE